MADLAEGPVWIAGGNGPDVERLSRPDRARIVLSAHDAMMALTGKR